MNSLQETLMNNSDFTQVPFPHFSADQILDNDLASDLLAWFKSFQHWQFTKTDFYTQYEFSLLDLVLPDPLASLSSTEFIEQIIHVFEHGFAAQKLKLVSITAHKLVDGYKMGVHNDFIGRAESHRLVIQLNDGWQEHNGGYLMLFNSKDPNDVASLIMPVHNSGIGFEISSKSFHAVSTVYNFERYTLVYTFSYLEN
jgi:Rps23 Pro-64 3,4-dihydroxylase Tpa1-like proline 4-hydroxylase